MLNGKPGSRMPALEDAARPCAFALVFGVRWSWGWAWPMPCCSISAGAVRGALVRSLTCCWALPTTVDGPGLALDLQRPQRPIHGVIAGLTGSTLPLSRLPSWPWLGPWFLTDVWRRTPFVGLLGCGGLQDVPRSLRARALEGGSAVRPFAAHHPACSAATCCLVLLSALGQAWAFFDLIVVLPRVPASSTESVGGLRLPQCHCAYLDYGYSATVMIGMFGV